jgi:hypothetical protein
MEMVKPSFVFDALRSLMDQIEAQTDPAVRLACYSYLLQDLRSQAVTGRDRAAYEARQRYSADDLAEVCGSDRQDIYYWSNQHRYRNDLPPLKRRYRDDLSNARDVMQALGVAR